MSEFYIGIDLGGTYVRIITYDVADNRISDINKKVFQRKGNVILEVEVNLCSLISAVCAEKEKENKQLAGIGISMAGLFNRETGIITQWPNNTTWNNFELKQYLEDCFHVPIVLEDDANAAAVGEHLIGAGKGYKDFVYITISTGIGCGIIVNDKLFIGYHGWAGEIGHTKITDDNTICTCGSSGCLQSKASGPAILKNFIQTKAFQNIKTFKKFDLEDVVLMAKNENVDAKKVFCEAGLFIGRAIANMVMLLDIPLVILGGGVMEAGDLILQPINDGLMQSLQNKRCIEIACSKLNNINGTLGALSLVDQYINKESTIMVL
jgi:glucokinase